MNGQGFSVLSAIFNKHTLIHGVMMVAMVLPGVAAAAASAGATATFGDLALAMWDMTKSTFAGLGSGGALVDAFSNAASGNFAANAAPALAEAAIPHMHHH